jgi:hypothetical protein
LAATPRSAGVDEAGDDDAAGGVDGLGVVGLDRGRDGFDAIVVDQDVADGQVALRVHRDDRGAADDDSRHRPSPATR